MEKEITPELKIILEDRRRILNEIDSASLADAFITIVQRAEMIAKITSVDQYISIVDNGITFFNEDQYNLLVEKTVAEFKVYLASQDLTDAEKENELDKYASKLVLHYIDHKKFTKEEIQAVQQYKKEK